VARPCKTRRRAATPEAREPAPLRAIPHESTPLLTFMVRRGSTVRVRQRASQRRCTSTLFLSNLLARVPVCGRYGAVYLARYFRSIGVVDQGVGQLAQADDGLCSGRLPPRSGLDAEARAGVASRPRSGDFGPCATQPGSGSGAASLKVRMAMLLLRSLRPGSASRFSTSRRS